MFVVDATVGRAISAAESASSGATAVCFADDGTAGAGTTATSWAISVPLRTDPTVSWCVDSSGISDEGDATLAANVASCT